MDAILQTYISFKANPENDGKKDTIFCQDMEVHNKELQRIKKENPNWRKAALDLRRETYAEQMTQVDQALFTAALGGDTRAADLLYRRFDGWNPKIVEQTNNYYNFADLVKDSERPTPKKVTHTMRGI